MQSVKDSLKDWVGPGYTYGFYDAYDPRSKEIVLEADARPLLSLGHRRLVDGCQRAEHTRLHRPAIPQRLCGPTALGPSEKYFNAYALMNADAIYNGQRGVDADKRVFLLTRSGFAGLQRYSTATWSGDIATRWEDMKAQISAGLNFAVSASRTGRWTSAASAWRTATWQASSSTITPVARMPTTRSGAN